MKDICFKNNWAKFHRKIPHLLQNFLGLFLSFVPQNRMVLETRWPFTDSLLCSGKLQKQHVHSSVTFSRLSPVKMLLLLLKQGVTEGYHRLSWPKTMYLHGKAGFFKFSSTLSQNEEFRIFRWNFGNLLLRDNTTR